MSDNQTKEGVIDQLIAFFASLKLTIFLFLLLAGTSILGTFIPQNADPRAYLQTFGEFLFRLFSVFGVFDIYHSWWFRLLIVLLTLNIIVCSIDRLSSVWKRVFTVKKRFAKGRFHNAPSIEFILESHFNEFRKEAEALVHSRYRHMETRVEEKEATLFGERWRWTRLGVYIVHLSVVLLLLGSLVGSIFGFDGFVRIPEGETVSSIRLRNRAEPLPLPFQLRCDDFDVRFYPNGAPEEFRSDLVIVENGQETVKKSIIVNDPLRYKGINIFQSSYGEIRDNPMMGGTDKPDSSEEAVVTSITDALLQVMVNETGMAYQVPVKLGEPVKLPANLGQFTYTGLIPHAKFGGHDIGEALTGILTRTGDEPEEVLLSIRFASFDKMRGGKLFITVLAPNAETLAGEDIHSYTETAGADERSYWTGLEVTRDPGVPLVYLGFCLMIAGCFAAFFMPHEQVMVTVAKRGQKSAVTVAATAYRNRISMQQKVRRLALQLGAEDTE